MVEELPGLGPPISEVEEVVAEQEQVVMEHLHGVGGNGGAGATTSINRNSYSKGWWWRSKVHLRWNSWNRWNGWWWKWNKRGI
jgi:hypothetical protein